VIDRNAVPIELRELDRWLLWRYERRGAEKPKKVPYSLDGRKADYTDPATWSPFRHVIRAATNSTFYDGIGFVLGDGYAGIDLDHCRDHETGVIAGWALGIAREIDSYTEITPSGTGLHVICRGKLPLGRRRKGDIEMYSEDRYFTFTAQHLHGTPTTIERRTGALAELHAKTFNSNDAGVAGDHRAETTTSTGTAPFAAAVESIVERLRKKCGTPFERLWRGNTRLHQSPSEADLALCSFIAQVTQDYATIDAVFRSSGLYREKWDRPDYRERTIRKALENRGESSTVPPVNLSDFYAYLPEHKYIYGPSRQLWPASSVNACINLRNAEGESISASAWLDRERPVQQMTWVPGEPLIIENRLVSQGGWIEKPLARVFNLYLSPRIEAGDPKKATPWLDHTRRVYPDNAEQIFDWCAHRVQRPYEKINHAIVCGGAQGIGKDTIFEPLKYAVGPWNFAEIGPAHLLGRFNGFAKAIVVRVSEARDLGDVDRFKFYEHLKTYTAAPPDVIRCDEKHIREHYVFNVCGVIITTNYKTGGMYLPADDRRHFVAWSDQTAKDFASDYFQNLYRWFKEEGCRHVAAYLTKRDISRFDAKAPPPKTPAFWSIVDANRAPEDRELADALEKLGTPDAVTVAMAANAAGGDFGQWLRDRRNSRQIPHRFEAAGYVAVRNEADKRDGLWKVDGARVVIYAIKTLSIRDQIVAAEQLTEAYKRR
jgi:hypothetical protein